MISIAEFNSLKSKIDKELSRLWGAIQNSNTHAGVDARLDIIETSGWVTRQRIAAQAVGQSEVEAKSLTGYNIANSTIQQEKLNMTHKIVEITAETKISEVTPYDNSRPTEYEGKLLATIVHTVASQRKVRHMITLNGAADQNVMASLAIFDNNYTIHAFPFLVGTAHYQYSFFWDVVQNAGATTYNYRLGVASDNFWLNRNSVGSIYDGMLSCQFSVNDLPRLDDY